MSNNVEKQVYGTEEILVLYGIKKDALPSYIQHGIIPEPINKKARQKKMWLKSTIDKALKINDYAPKPAFSKSDIKSMVLDVITELTGSNGAVSSNTLSKNH